MSSFPKSNIPDPDYIQLLGRDGQLSSLKQLLSSSERSWIVAIEGLGGIGKTALAIETCRYFQKQHGRLPDEERYDYIVWTSAKIEDMTPQGPMRRSEMQITLASIYSKIADVLELPDRLSLTDDQLLEKIYLALRQNRVLIIIDSFEQLEKPEAVIEFIKNIPLPSKILITTRPQQTINKAETVKIIGLEPEESLKLINGSTIARNLNEEQKLELSNASSGIPLVIKWALGRIELRDPYSSVINKLKKGDINLSQYCVSDSIDFIKGQKAEEIIFALLLLVSPVSRQTIGEIVDLSKDVKIRDDAIKQLVGLQLIAKGKNDKFSLATIARAALLKEYDKNKQKKIVQKWANYYLQFVVSILGIHGRVDSYSDNLQKVLVDVDNLVEILRSVGEVDPNLYCDLLEACRYILYMRGNWVERDIFLIKGKDIAQKNNHWCRQLLFASDLAWVSTYRQQYDRSDWFFKSVTPALENCNQSYYKAKYYMDLGRYHQLTALTDTDYADAEKYYFLAMDEAKNANPPLVRSTCLYYLGLLYYQIGNKTQAKSYLEEGIQLANALGASRESDRHQSMLAIILAESGQYTEAKKIFERIVANAESSKDRVRQADYILAHAKVECMVENRQGALALFNQAENLYSELGRNQEFEEIRQLRREEGLI